MLFEELEDSRQDWKVKHSLTEILTVAMCGIIAECDELGVVISQMECSREKTKVYFK